MAQNVTLLGASYSAVPSVDLPKTGGGTASFFDVSDTTAAAADVASGKYFYTSAGVRTAGTASGGGGGVNIGTKSVTNSSNTATSLNFTGLSGQPKAFFVRATSTITSSGNTSYYYVVSMVYDGSSTEGTYFRIGSTRAVYNDTSHYSYTYSNGTLQVKSSGSRTAAGGSFYNGTYELVYIY